MMIDSLDSMIFYETALSSSERLPSVIHYRKVSIIPDPGFPRLDTTSSGSLVTFIAILTHHDVGANLVFAREGVRITNASMMITAFRANTRFAPTNTPESPGKCFDTVAMAILEAIDPLENGSNNEELRRMRITEGKLLPAILLVVCLQCLAVVGIASASALEIVSSGSAKAIIVVPDKPLPVVSYAAQELQYHIEQSTGARLRIVRESEKSEESSAFIYVGDCRSAVGSGIKTHQFPPNAFKIKSIENSLFLAGRDSDGPPLQDNTHAGSLFAVYDFLEKQLGVRWLWPGKLGEVIPRRHDLSVTRWDQYQTPKLLHTRLRFSGTYLGTDAGWSSPDARTKFIDEARVWIRRHRFARGISLEYGHGSEDYWTRFSKSHPEFFNLLPNGKREPDPLYHGGQGYLVSMCLSEPKLWKQKVEDWKSRRTADLPWVNCAENDTQTLCTCSSCRAWDAPARGDEVSMDLVRTEYAEHNLKWWEHLGSVSDRYAKWCLAVQREAEKIEPGATVLGYAYTNYSKPPVKTKLNKRVVIAIVPDFVYPWSDAKSEAFRKQWGGWAASGASLYLRPNYFLDGHNMPVYFAERFGGDFTFALKHGMMSTDFDSLTGMFGTQGPNLYAVAQMNAHPDRSARKVLDEYYSAFGPAEKAVREYFAHWRSVSDSATDELISKTAEARGLGSGVVFYRVADVIFTPNVMAKGRSILAKAREAAGGDKTVEDRIAFLEKGLTNAELTLAVEPALQHYKKTGEAALYEAAINKLDAYRARVESDDICNMGFLRLAEDVHWDRDFRIMKTGEDLSSSWKLQWDPENAGVSRTWFASDVDDSGWYDVRVGAFYEEQEVGKKWKKEHGVDYTGVCWYRTSFQIKPLQPSGRVRLLFGAIDESATIWVNGKLIVERPYPYEGDPDSWRKAFEVDVTDFVCADQLNTLAVRVENKTGAGGIWKPVRIFQNEGEMSGSSQI